MSSPRIYYATRPDATPEVEISALANVYRLILDSKKAAPSSGPDDVKGSRNDSRRKVSIP